FLREGHTLWKRIREERRGGEEEKKERKKEGEKRKFGERIKKKKKSEKEEDKAVVNALDKALGAGVGRRFLRHPLIAPMVVARSRMRATVKADGGVRDCFGNWLALDEHNPNKEDRVTWRSLLAQQAQAVEVALMDEVFKVAETTEHFFIAVYKYDGIAVAWRNKRDCDRWIAAMQEAVQKKADEMGIATRLVLED
ncbi:hypothetical protein SE17_17110, partial [Kouleothrix aurantiaca]